MDHNARIVLYALSAALCLAGCSRRGIDESLTQEIELDDSHNVAVTKDSNAPAYRIARCGGLLVNTEGLRRPKNLDPNEGPNAIHVIESQTQRYYRAEWRESRQILLGRSTLVAVTNAPQFKGFEAGESCVIAIGKDNYGEKGAAKLVFKPIWVGKIEVASQ